MISDDTGAPGTASSQRSNAAAPSSPNTSRPGSRSVASCWKSKAGPPHLLSPAECNQAGLDLPTGVSTILQALEKPGVETGLRMAGWANTVLRIAGGLLLLVLLSFAASPASAHASHDRVGQTAPPGQSVTRVTASRDASVSPAPVGGMPGGQRACDTCPTCCGVGACSMFSATVASGLSVTAWLPKVSAAYGSGSYRQIFGLRSIPATKPPRLDA